MGYRDARRGQDRRSRGLTRRGPQPSRRPRRGAVPGALLCFRGGNTPASAVRTLHLFLYGSRAKLVRGSVHLPSRLAAVTASGIVKVASDLCGWTDRDAGSSVRHILDPQGVCEVAACGYAELAVRPVQVVLDGPLAQEQP
jgi:hypothetical protein